MADENLVVLRFKDYQEPATFKNPPPEWHLGQFTVYSPGRIKDALAAQLKKNDGTDEHVNDDDTEYVPPLGSNSTGTAVKKTYGE